MAAVQIADRRLYVQFQRSDTAQTISQARLLRRQNRAVGDHGDVGGKPFRMFGDEGVDILRTGFFLAFQHNLDIDLGFLRLGQPGFHRLEIGHNM